MPSALRREITSSSMAKPRSEIQRRRQPKITWASWTLSPAVAFAFSLSLASCARAGGESKGKPKDDKNQVLATVGKTVITVQDLEDQLNRQAPYVRKRYESVANRKEFLENLVRFEILAQEAAKRGFDKDPAVVRSMKQVMIKRLLKKELGGQISLEGISEDEINAYFEANQEEFNTEAQVRVAAVILKNAREAKSVAKLATESPGITNKGFRDLVDRYSIDEATKLRGGDLRYFTKTTKEVPTNIVSAAFSLENIGDVAGPLKAKKGYYVIKLMGMRPARSRTIDQVRGQVQNRIYQDKRSKLQNAFVGGLRANAKIQVFEKNLRKIKIEKETK